MSKKNWEEKNYEKELCEFCPKTEHGEKTLDFIGTKYERCPEDLCEVAESYKKEDDLFQQECRENEYLSLK